VFYLRIKIGDLKLSKELKKKLIGSDRGRVRVRDRVRVRYN